MEGGVGALIRYCTPEVSVPAPDAGRWIMGIAVDFRGSIGVGRDWERYALGMGGLTIP